MKKKVFLLIILTVFFLPVLVKAEYQVPKVDNTKKVYDYANLLSDEEEETLYKKAINFIEKYNMDMVLVTIDDNPYGSDDRSVSLYAEDFYEYSEFGINSSHDGIIILIDMDNRAPCVTATGQAILIYDDERKIDMNDDAYDYLADAKYYDAFLNYIESASNYAEKGTAPSNELFCVDEQGEYYQCREEEKSVNWLVTILGSIFGSLCPVLVHTKKYRGIKAATKADTYLKESEITGRQDRFLTTFTSRVPVHHDDGGGHGGGGSSISRGSGGMSHSSSVGKHF